jgi:transposase-like protein
MTDVMTTKKPKTKKQYPFPVELIDQLLAQVENKDAELILGESGLAGQLKKMLAERMLTAELPHHLATTTTPRTTVTARAAKPFWHRAASWNWRSPRDRLSSFEPKLVAKHQRRMPGFDDHVIGTYARGMTVREIYHRPSTSLRPSARMPSAKYTALFLTVPSSRIFSRSASNPRR